jgi:hypothetical protein
MIRIRILAVVALAALVAVVMPGQPASATPLGYTQMTIDGSDLIYAVDLGTGATALVGDTGLEPATTSLAFAPDGTLYGVNDSDLVTIDTATGAATVVGSLTCCANARGLTFAADGTLYLLMGNPGTFHSVDTTTGAATAIGGMGPNFIGGLGATCDGVFALDSVDDTFESVDVATGATTAIGPLGANGNGGLSTDTSGQLWLLGRPEAPVSSESFTIDSATGAATFVATVTGNAPSALALAPLDCEDPPPSSTTTTTSTTATPTTSTSTPTTTTPRPPAARPVVASPAFAG